MGTCCFSKGTEIIDKFNMDYKDRDYDNTKIELSMKICKLHNIGEEGFNQFCSIFCSIKLNFIEFLYLSNNNISDITELKNFKTPKLKNLDLSCNSIKNIDIFQKIRFQNYKIKMMKNIIKIYLKN